MTGTNYSEDQRTFVLFRMGTPNMATFQNYHENGIGIWAYVPAKQYIRRIRANSRDQLE